MSVTNFDLPEAIGGVLGVTPGNTRPVVPFRTEPAPAIIANPFKAVEEASKLSSELNDRLQELADRFAGALPGCDVPAETASGLLGLSAARAQNISARCRHGISLIDAIEEHLQ